MNCVLVNWILFYSCVSWKLMCSYSIKNNLVMDLFMFLFYSTVVMICFVSIVLSLGFSMHLVMIDYFSIKEGKKTITCAKCQKKKLYSMEIFVSNNFENWCAIFFKCIKDNFFYVLFATSIVSKNTKLTAMSAVAAATATNITSVATIKPLYKCDKSMCMCCFAFYVRQIFNKSNVRRMDFIAVFTLCLHRIVCIVYIFFFFKRNHIGRLTVLACSRIVINVTRSFEHLIQHLYSIYMRRKKRRNEKPHSTLTRTNVRTNARTLARICIHLHIIQHNTNICTLTERHANTQQYTSQYELHTYMYMNVLNDCTR